MKFYTNPLSTSCRKVDATAKHLDIPLEHVVLDVIKGESRTPEFLAINPNGKVPALVDGDVVLWESNAIACYVASKVESELWPKTNARYDIMRWQAWELAHFGAAAGALTFERVVKPALGAGKPNEARCADEEANFARFAKILDDWLAHRRYLVNDRLTLADFCVAAPLSHAEHARLPLREFRNLRRWLAALDESPSWRASAPPPM